MPFDPNLYQEKYRIPSARAEWWEYCEGIYFITIVTKWRRHYFGEIKRDPETRRNQMHLSPLGKFVDDEIPKITDHHPYAYIPSWVVMPNHIHFIVMIDVRGRDKNAEYGDERDNRIRGRADDRAETKKYADDVGRADERAETKLCADDVGRADERAETKLCADDVGRADERAETKLCADDVGRDARTARLYHGYGDDDNDVRADARADDDGDDDNDVRADDDDVDIESENIENIFKRTKTDRRTSELMSAITPKSGSLPVVINQFKRAVTMYARTHKISFDWQTRYYDKILKNQNAFDNVRRYIDNNVAKWHADHFYHNQ